MKKTKQLLAYLIKNRPNINISITSLMKLTYIIDLVSINKIKKQISDFEYTRYKYGPFDKKIYGYLKNLLDKKIINEDVDYTQNGEQFIIYNFAEKRKISFDELANDEKNIIDEVLENLRGYGTRALVELTYRTKPMKKIGAEIGNDKGLNKKLDLKAR